MTKLDNLVHDILTNFIEDKKLFTALDISNEVKKIIPNSHHKEIRDIVKSFYDEMVDCNYFSTPITVNLNNGYTATALLYHPLEDSWDLDNKYDLQKRSQQATIPIDNTTTDNSGLPPKPATGFIKYGDDTTDNNINDVVVTTSNTNVPKTWAELFASTKSLFPGK